MTRKAVGIAVALIFGLGILFVSFMDGAQTTAGAETAEKPGATTPPPAAGNKGDGGKAEEKAVTFDPEKLPKVIATVNDSPINREMFVQIMKNIVADIQAHGQTLTEERLKSVEHNLVDQWVNTELLYQEATAQKINADEKEVDKQVEGFKSRFPSEDEFKKWLGQQNITLADMKNDIRRNLAWKTLIEEKVIKDVKVSDAEAEKYYKANKAMFNVPEMIRARHIFVKVAPDATAEQKAAAKKKMDEVVAKLKAGKKFEDAAKEYSEDSTKDTGGDLGLRPRGAFVKEFEDAAYALKPGKVSGVVTSQFGLHVIKLEEKKAAGIMPLKDVKKEVVRGLEADAKREKVSKFVAALKAKAKIQINL